MRIVFFNRFFYPDESATSQMVSDLAFHLAGRDEVLVVTSATSAAPDPFATIRGVRVHRVAAATAGPHGLARRALDYALFYRAARAAARHLIRPGDVVVAKTDPPMLSVALAKLAKAREAAFVVWLQDLFPEVAQAYGIPGTSGLAGGWLRRVRDRSLARADLVVAIGERMRRRAAEFGCIDPMRLHVIHNWADGHAVTPVPSEENELRIQWQLDSRFVVGYSGNLGRVHEFETLLGAAEVLRDQVDIVFLFVGGGPRLREVQAHARTLGLGNVQFRPPQPRHLLGQSLCVADVHVSVLRPEFEGLVVPSKLYGTMAAGRPTIFVGDPSGESARILAAAGAGLSVNTGDASALAEALLELRRDRPKREHMGRLARRSFEAAYDMPIAMARWREALVSCNAQLRPS